MSSISKDGVLLCVFLRIRVCKIQLIMEEVINGIPLKDQDATTRKDGEWTKSGTHGYYMALLRCIW